MTKMMALVIALVMCMSFAVVANAASITINPGDDATGTVSTEYTYYELLKASIDGDNVVYYLPVSTGGTALKNLLDAVTYTKTVEGESVTVTPFSFTQSADGTRWNAVISDSVADGDGELLATALNTEGIKAAALATGDFEQDGGSAVAEDLDPGYYLITSTLGSKLVLQTLNDVEINTKNSYITNTKTASETNMEVGEKVTYTITVNIPATAIVGDTVTVHDTLDEHLAILDDEEAIAASAGDYYITAVIGGTTTAVTLSDGTKKATTETFAKSFNITQAMIDAGSVVLTYKAELLSTAADDTGYVNTVFSNTDAYETLPSTVDVYTFDINVDKTFSGVDDDDADDYEATFELRKGSAAGTAIQFITDNTGYVVADSNDNNASATITVTGGDAVNIRGLDDDTVYYLVEITTADGFNLLSDPVIITITDTTEDGDDTPSHTVSYKVGESGEATNGTTAIAILNQSGSVLPSTGGIGTTIFYIVGAILVIGAGVLLVSRKRMGSK